MKVKIKFFGHFRSEIPCDENGYIDIDVRDGINVEDLMKEHELWNANEALVMLNGSSDKTAKLKENDVLQVFPLVAGG